MTTKKVETYTKAAGGWGAVISTTKNLLKSENAFKNIRSLLNTNQHKGFDCPGCAWGDNKAAGAINFCENGAKAVNWEATSRKADAAFFQQHTVSYLQSQSDYFLEYQGRLTEPMIYHPEDDKFHPITWHDAFAKVATHLNNLADPNQAEFYTSGRTSNEAAYLYQLFIRCFGTNNMPDCSNMCHEASGVALTQALGIGKGSVTMADFEKADTIFVFGQNPGSNHPRMLDALRDAAKRGANILSFNNLKERGLERFTHPQKPAEMLTNGYTQISTNYYRPKLGGDMALVRGIVKELMLMEADAQAVNKAIFDHDFIEQHTSGLQEYLALVDATPWALIESQSGISRKEIQTIATVYAESERVIFCWAMGITQHKHSVAMIQEFVNLLLLRGNIGKEGAGTCPVRGHSNVQGDRTMGINEKSTPEWIARLEKHFDVSLPKEHGHNAVQAVNAMLEGKVKTFFALGGNFVSAMSDTEKTTAALKQCDLVVNVSTKLNRSHLTLGKKDSLILPCLGRTEIDLTSAGEQRITVEDSMSMVHSSGGVLAPISDQLKSEVNIVASLAQATLGDAPIDWLQMSEDNRQIRSHIAATLPGFENFNERLEQKGGFYLGNSSAERRWNTNTQKANFSANALPDLLVGEAIAAKVDKPILTMQTMRSHDQYNTTVYSYDDRYRGITGLRNVIFMNAADIEKLGLEDAQQVSITSHWHDGSTRQLHGFRVVKYDIPQGNVAAYYPETNPLVPLDSVGDKSFTPTSKSIAVTIEPMAPEALAPSMLSAD
ncbi:FdhF/YdeP family oxidoreductase [Marinomonas agarivorans]|nr:FdhF/YdeP family oxidoreductase [Marinomonas agarivorans]